MSWKSSLHPHNFYDVEMDPEYLMQREKFFQRIFLPRSGSLDVSDSIHKIEVPTKAILSLPVCIAGKYSLVCHSRLKHFCHLVSCILRVPAFELKEGAIFLRDCRGNGGHYCKHLKGQIVWGSFLYMIYSVALCSWMYTNYFYVSLF